MNYTEIEEVLRDHGKATAIEQLRAAVGQEALELKDGLQNSLDEVTAVEQARTFFAEDISRWMVDGGNLEPDIMIESRRGRYVASWAFAQVIYELKDSGGNVIEIPEVDPDTLIQICLANATMGSKLVELVEMVHENSHVNGLAEAIETMDRSLTGAGAPTNAPNGHRKLAIWERLESLIEELEDLRSEQRKK